jgi:hypothetical protein
MEGAAREKAAHRFEARCGLTQKFLGDIVAEGQGNQITKMDFEPQPLR